MKQGRTRHICLLPWRDECETTMRNKRLSKLLNLSPQCPYGVLSLLFQIPKIWDPSNEKNHGKVNAGALSKTFSLLSPPPEKNKREHES